MGDKPKIPEDERPPNAPEPPPFDPDPELMVELERGWEPDEKKTKGA